MQFDQFRFREPALTLLAARQKASLFRWVTRKVPPLFLCGGDVMTIGEFIKLTRGKEYRLTDRPEDGFGTIVLLVERA